MRLARTLVPVVTALCALTAGTATATAAPEPSATPEFGFATQDKETQLQQELAKSKPVIATYKGKKIDLSQGWQGAQACSEVPSGEVFCYDTVAQADRALAALAPAAEKGRKSAGVAAKETGQLGPTAASDCTYGWVCLWEHSNFSGRRLQWSAKGTKQLSDWSFRDQASSGCVNRDMQGALVYDARTAQLDPYMALGNLGCYDFTKASYPGGGNWNDKADYMEM
ncbi:peptidase inhibitor family I36 protein [Streptomyces sp. NPDC002773]|uniref:peptidase inhibitor family I36 protein n=1 Tax=Streptomyces sp. NPDC002773 TaxID=3154430 RepID=UPI00331FC9B2